MNSIAERIKEGLERRQLKQSDLARMTGISKGTLSSYLSGRYLPKQNNLCLIAAALKVSEEWLMGKDNLLNRNPLIPQRVEIQVFEHLSFDADIDDGAAEEALDTEEITEKLAVTGTFFGLKIADDSMNPGICRGDVVIVRKQEDAESGDIVIAAVKGSLATCKRLRKYKDGFELIAANPVYRPLEFSKKEIKEKSVQIMGKVVELRRRFS